MSTDIFVCNIRKKADFFEYVGFTEKRQKYTVIHVSVLVPTRKSSSLAKIRKLIKCYTMYLCKVYNYKKCMEIVILLPAIMDNLKCSISDLMLCRENCNISRIFCCGLCLYSILNTTYC